MTKKSIGILIAGAAVVAWIGYRPAPAPVVPNPAPEAKSKLVYISVPRCAACVKMERGTFQDPKVKSRLEHFQFVKIAGPDAAYPKATSFPAYFLFDPTGKEVKRASGYKSPAEFLAWLDVAQEAGDEGREGAGDTKSEVAGPKFNGREITVDLPPQEQFANIGSKIDGAGMCVFTSIELAARSQGLEQMRGYRDWWASVSRGGGWPDQVDKSLAAWWKHRKIDPVPYMQYEGADPEKMLDLIDKTGRMACLTYGWSPRYPSSISHMVCAPSFRKYGVVLDNNFVAKKSGNGWDENIFEWMSREELCRRAKLTGGHAWVFVWLPPPAPPPAKSKGV